MRCTNEILSVAYYSETSYIGLLQGINGVCSTISVITDFCGIIIYSCRSKLMLVRRFSYGRLIYISDYINYYLNMEMYKCLFKLLDPSVLTFRTHMLLLDLHELLN